MTLSHFLKKHLDDIILKSFLQNPLVSDKYKKEIQSMNSNFYVNSWSDLNKSFFSALKS